jgi:hypothetical protein
MQFEQALSSQNGALSPSAEFRAAGLTSQNQHNQKQRAGALSHRLLGGSRGNQTHFAPGLSPTNFAKNRIKGNRGQARAQSQ